MLTARKPSIDLDKAAIVWSKIPEFAHFFNATGAAIPNIEHFLNSVINEVRQQVADQDPELTVQLRLFIQQEANHTAYHDRFNKRMFDAGYAQLRPVLREIARELQHLRRTRSLEFCASYCAGFENAATYSAKYLLESCEDLFEDAEPNGANLILWHVAEEFEHRSVCHEAFETISGSWALRVWGLVYAFWHINYSFARCRRVIFEIFRQGMTKAERKASIRRERRVLWRQAAYMLPRALRLFSPWFHPAQLKVSPQVEQALAMFAGTGAVVRTPYTN